MNLLLGDSLEIMRQMPDNYFSAACFSPPYGTSSKGFDVRKDFHAGGKFIPYAQELGRTCRVWAINLAQKVIEGENLLFIENLVLCLDGLGIKLFDRWVMVKNTAKPKRGNRALVNFEYVLLFSRDPKALVKRGGEGAGKCAFLATSHAASAATGLGYTPYSPEIPRRVFSLYGYQRVLDPFVGSGTSLREAARLNLEGTGIELDPGVWNATKRDLGL
jgi:hypothetical protein